METKVNNGGEQQPIDEQGRYTFSNFKPPNKQTKKFTNFEKQSTDYQKPNNKENPFTTDRLTKHEEDTLERMFDSRKQKYQVVNMSPEEYFKLSAAMFGTTPEKLKEQRKSIKGESGLDIDNIRELMRKGEKFGMPYIQYNSSARGEDSFGSQEGLHRMMAAGEEYGWDKKFPVAFVQLVNDNTEYNDIINNVDNLIKRNVKNRKSREAYYDKKKKNEKQKELETISLELGIPLDKLTEKDINHYYEELDELFVDLF